MRLDDATLRQNQAAEPEHSTWLSANAGSGKTRVLTNRVALLLLDGVEPQNILCLTYTKAAASEMQNRLFERFGDWSMRTDGELAEALQRLGVKTLGSERLAQARRLFARAIETPGGLRIQTIHSFCAALLRRFPLEAGVTPRFAEMDDRAAALLQEEVVELLADGIAPDAVDAIAAHFTGDDLGRLTSAILTNRKAFETGADRAEIWRWLDLPEGFDMPDVLAAVFDEGEAAPIAALLQVLGASSSSTDQKAHARLSCIDWARPGAEALDALTGVMLYGAAAKAPFTAKVDAFPTKAARAALGASIGGLNALMLRVEAARERRNRLYSARKTLALHRFAAAFLPEYERRKRRRGWLDFDDLILKTLALLSDEAVAAWVLFRLDGGLDHILVDEAQDTSPAQWQVIERLAREFTAGQGARDGVRRTIFVVGDKKQSIYSFQGADPREFDRMQAHFDLRLRGVGESLRELGLEYSFRSSDAVLRFVDATTTIDGMRHRAFRERLPGRVDLWPPVPKPEKPEKPHWYDPVDMMAEDHHAVKLARDLAARIAAMIAGETIPDGKGGRRRVRAGDIMILVRRRSELFEEIIRACKALGLPVAGADRLKLGAELAVKDLAAVLAFLATPEDDLSLAAALKSPLFGWDEAALYDLAHGRPGTLWQALRGQEAQHPATLAMLRDLRDSANYLRPYDLIERILTRHDGRRRLLARLGAEAEDGIDALLQQSLAYERAEVPSLTGFLGWLETDDVEVKRQMDAAGDLIRVMTVHGAKGLEAPVVILPDTAKRTLPNRDELIPLDGGGVLWRVPRDQRPEIESQALTRLKTAQAEEEQRLFYVATTRAETWLIIAAAGEVGEGDQSWHQKAEEALRALGAVELITPVGVGLRYQHLDWEAGDHTDAPAPPAAPPAVPDWALARAAPVDRPEPPRAPSDLGGAKALAGEGGQDDAAARRRGSAIHLLLEVLPAVAAPHRASHAARLLTGGEMALDQAEAAEALASAARVLDHPDFAELLGPDALAEVAISAGLDELGGARVAGAIDRLLVSGDRVLAVDFKTNAVVPEKPGDVPEGLLRQMGAYLAALQQVYPGRRVDIAILWTETPRLMPLPHDIVRAALCRAATS